jgi:hypothetical protein
MDGILMKTTQPCIHNTICPEAIMSKKRSAIQILLPAVILLLSYAVASSSADRASGLVAPGATIKTVQSGFSGTEGPAADAEGNIYFTEKAGNSIQKWTWKDNKIALPEQKCKNLKFGGKDRKTLFICGNTAVYTLEMSVRGASAPLDSLKNK